MSKKETNGSFKDEIRLVAKKNTEKENPSED